MAEQLGKLRSELIERLSLEVINQILDGLTEGGVLNDGEKDRIIQANKTRADKARDLIDTVKKKGNTASEKMLVLIKSKDSTLYSALVRDPE